MRALKKSQTGVTEIDIFDQFMTEQYLNQKEKFKFDTVKDQSSCRNIFTKIGCGPNKNPIIVILNFDSSLYLCNL